MINIKWGIVSAGAAFALAFVLSLLMGRTGLIIALFRAGVFAALFFGLGIGIWALINTFIPELLPSGADEDTTANLLFGGAADGSRVNIIVDDTSNANLSAAIPEENKAANTDDVGNFSDLLVAGITRSSSEDIDQNPTTGYTEEAKEFTPAFEDIKLTDKGAEKGDFSLDFGAFVPDSFGSDGMDDLELGMDSFSLLSDSGNSGSSGDSSAPERKVSENKPMKLEGDFQPKEIAAGIRTVLEKDKKRG